MEQANSEDPKRKKKKKKVVAVKAGELAIGMLEMTAPFQGSGNTTKKIENAKAIQQIAQNNQLPKPNPGTNWKRPFGTLYGDFNKWLEKQDKVMHKRDTLGHSDMAYAWYKEDSPISIFDRDDFKEELFSTKEIQEQYKKYLDAATGVNGDPIIIKLQSGNILADERAFYIRHASIARSMALGLMSNRKVDFIDEVYKNYIRRLRDRFDKEWEDKHENRYKGDGTGNNSKEVTDPEQ